MGRAPTGAVPQRVSAHVLPKAPSFVSDEEDEKTMIEAGWEEEASTTVEQGDVADKVRALGIGLDAPKRTTSSITAIGNNTTSEEQTVDDQRASAAVALLPPPIVARLVITVGNDLGQSLEIRAGKTYTVGRGIDNDLVLTDLAVSRKHFDIRYDNGSWMLADRGSGNGTLVNARVEDAPFVLTSGDMVEIGNTAFRFELPVVIPDAPAASSVDAAGEDDLELSSTPRLGAVPVGRSKPVIPLVPQQQTVPMPRPRAPTSRPLASYVLDRPGAQPSPIALSGLAVTHVPNVAQQTTAPVLHTASRPQVAEALDSFNPPQPTLPGHTPALLTQPGRLPFSYPSRSSVTPQATPGGTRVPLHSPTPQPGQPGREHTSTAVVQPMSYTNQLPLLSPPARRGLPQLSQRAKLALGSAGIVLFVVIVTLALGRGAGGEQELEVPAPLAARPALISEPAARAPARPDIKADPRQAKSATDKPGSPNAIASSLPAPAADPGELAKVPPASAVRAAPAPARPERAEAPTPAPRPDIKRPVKRLEVKKPERKAVRAESERDEVKTDAVDRKRAGRALQDLKNEANVLYRAKSFSGAAAQITASLALFSGDDVKDLKNVASTYSQLGKAYNIGMAPGTKPTDAYTALVRAKTLDRDVGQAYTAEIELRLATVAARAAMSFMAAKDYESAFQAVRTADGLGTAGSSTKSVRDNLDSIAADLVRAATKEMASDPDAAKKKLRQVLGIVDGKNPLYIRASKLLNGP